MLLQEGVMPGEPPDAKGSDKRPKKRGPGGGSPEASGSKRSRRDPKEEPSGADQIDEEILDDVATMHVPTSHT
jgi:hypothetical protein